MGVVIETACKKENLQLAKRLVNLWNPGAKFSRGSDGQLRSGCRKRALTDAARGGTRFSSVCRIKQLAISKKAHFQRLAASVFHWVDLRATGPANKQTRAKGGLPYVVSARRSP